MTYNDINLRYGCFKSSISSLLMHSYHSISEYGVVRAVDSEDTVSKILTSITAYGITGNACNIGVWLSKADLKRLNEAGLFSGFDEIWFFEHLQTIEITPDDLPILTSDNGPVDQQIASDASMFMKRYSAPLLVGDGCGLNCVTYDLGIWNDIVSTYQRIDKRSRKR